MSIFESLLKEPDNNTRILRLLDVVQPRIRDKIIRIFDTNTTVHIIPDGQSGIARITYKNSYGKVILTSTGIDRVDEFGTMWSVASMQPTKKLNN